MPRFDDITTDELSDLISETGRKAETRLKDTGDLLDPRFQELLETEAYAIRTLTERQQKAA